VAQAWVDRLRLLVLVHGTARGHLVPRLRRLQEVHQLVVHVHLLQAACNTGIVCEGKKVVLGIRTRNRIRIRMFLGLPDPDPLVRDTDPDPEHSLFS
jgi:hypothetical protein